MSNIADAAVDAQSKRPKIIAISVIFPVLSILVVSLRLYTRHFMLRRTGPDDWVIVVALVLAIGVSIEVMLEAYFGLGLHEWAVPPDMLADQMKALYASILTYNMANNVIKISFLLQYRRILGTSSPRADRLCLLLLAFIIIWALVQAILLSVSCIPVAAIVPSMADKCLDTMPIWTFSSSLNIVTDFAIFIIPLPCVYRMAMCTRQKILVFSIFCLGFFTCIISIVRLFSISIVTTTADPTWDNTELTLWSVAELNSGILCASLQTLKPLLSKLAPRLFSSRLSGDDWVHWLSCSSDDEGGSREMEEQAFLLHPPVAHASWRWLQSRIRGARGPQDHGRAVG